MNILYFIFLFQVYSEVVNGSVGNVFRFERKLRHDSSDVFNRVKDKPLLWNSGENKAATENNCGYEVRYVNFFLNKYRALEHTKLTYFYISFYLLIIFGSTVI